MDIGNFTLDTLQIYFPWDDDLYTYLKDKGFGKSGLGSKTLPLIYSDNTESTVGQKELQRKFVIRPELFGKTYAELGWKQTKGKSEPIIPSEKSLVNIKIDNDKIIFKIIPKGYHLEYSSRFSFGKMYSNWVAIYLSVEEFKKMLKSLKKEFDTEKPNSSITLKKELKQNQREEVDYVEVPIVQYEFSLEEFDHARQFLRLNGFKDKIPSLAFDSTEAKAKSLMEPLAKVGILHTTTKTGFIERKPQFVIKISQNKITTSQRGKRAKVKGLIKILNNENKFILKKNEFINSLLRLIGEFKHKHKDIDLEL